MDFFGTVSYADYIIEEDLAGCGIRWDNVDEETLRSRFTSEPGKGYYAHPDFLSHAKERASQWIAKHRPYFDGTIEAAIPGLLRRTTLSSKESADRLRLP